MNYVNKFAYLSLDEQKAVGLFICHLFANAQTQSWALYFSEWKVGDVNPGGEGDSSDEDEEEVPERYAPGCQIFFSDK